MTTTCPRGGMAVRATRGDTKTPKSRRTLALPPVAVTALRDHREAQDADRLAAWPDYTDDGLVFCTEVDTPVPR